MASENLNTGLGGCKANFEVLIKTPLSIIMLGGGAHFFETFMKAVHRYNRHAPTDDFVGVNFPDFDATKSGDERRGKSLLLVGSKEALNAVMSDPQAAPLVEEFDLDDIYPHVTPETGHATFRSQACEKHTLGSLQRRMRRAQARGKDTSQYEKGIAELKTGNPRLRNKSKATPDLSINMGKVTVHMKISTMKGSEAPEVTTYGLSSKDRPLVCQQSMAA